jgi:hypothetical protein
VFLRRILALGGPILEVTQVFRTVYSTKWSCFHSAKFGWAHFHSANFEDRCDFAQATFTNIASFMNSRFTDSGKFRDAKFHSTSYFDVAKASIPAVQLDFYGAKFINHPPYFLAARCMGIQIGQMLNGRAPSNP